LGAGRHPCCGGRRYTDADAHCDRDANVKPYRYSDSDRDSIGNRHTATDANAQSGAITKAAPNAFAQAIALPSTQNFS
jgi:hypothetical protein